MVPALTGDASTPADWAEALAPLVAAHRAGGPVHYVGGPADSITEGVGASSRAATWWSLFARAMTTGLGQPTRAIGSAEVTLESAWTVWSCAGGVPDEASFCLGKYGLTLHPGTVLSTTQAFDRVELVYGQLQSILGFDCGRMEVRLDGDPVAVLDCRGPTRIGRVWDSGIVGPFRDRLLEIVSLDGVVPVGHAYFHDGAPPGQAYFWRHARRRGTSSVGLFGFAEPQGLSMGPFTAGRLVTTPEGDPVFGAGEIPVSCFLLCCGTNDILEFDNDRRRIAEGYRRLIAHLRARCDTDPAIGVIVPTASTQFGGDYSALLDGIVDACRSDGAFLIDLWHGLGSHADDSFGYYSDGLHPNDRGHAAWADYVCAWMSEAVGPPVVASPVAAPASSGK